MDAAFRKLQAEKAAERGEAAPKAEPHEQRLCRDLIERLLGIKQRSNEVCAKCRYFCWKVKPNMFTFDHF